MLAEGYILVRNGSVWLEAAGMLQASRGWKMVGKCVGSVLGVRGSRAVWSSGCP